MDHARVLIVEDELFVALDLELLVHQHLPSAQVVLCSSVSEAQAALDQPVSLALLDIDVTDGKTFAVAAHLHASETPFVFVSGSRPEEVPPDLATAPFITKPLAAPQLEQALRAMMARGTRR